MASASSSCVAMISSRKAEAPRASPVHALRTSTLTAKRAAPPPAHCQGIGECAGQQGALRRREAFLVGGVALALALGKPAPARAGACELIAAGQGLKYCDIKVGKGRPVKNNDYISIVYQGTDVKTRDVFDSSPPDEPLEFRIGEDEVIQGWELGIMGTGEDMPPMNYGGVRKVIIPSKLAYGAEGYACKYDSSKRGGMNCLVSPYDEIEMVMKVLGD